MKEILKTQILSVRTVKAKTGRRSGRGFLKRIFCGKSAKADEKTPEKPIDEKVIYSFLVIYKDDSREIIDVTKGDDTYRKLIMYFR